MFIIEALGNRLPDIVRRVIMEATIEKVWHSITTSEALAVWCMPNDFEPVLGHEITFRSKPKGNWDGIVYCKVMELEPPCKLGFTWSGAQLEQYVSFELKDLGGRTELIMTHAGWYEEQAALREVMYDGWGHILENFKARQGDKNETRFN